MLCASWQHVLFLLVFVAVCKAQDMLGPFDHNVSFELTGGLTSYDGTIEVIGPDLMREVVCHHFYDLVAPFICKHLFGPTSNVVSLVPKNNEPALPFTNLFINCFNVTSLFDCNAHRLVHMGPCPNSSLSVLTCSSASASVPLSHITPTSADTLSATVPFSLPAQQPGINGTDQISFLSTSPFPSFTDLHVLEIGGGSVASVCSNTLDEATARVLCHRKFNTSYCLRVTVVAVSGRGQIRVADRYPTCSPTANSIHDCIWVPEKRTSCPGDLFAQINCTCTIDTPTAATTTASDGPFGDVTSSFTVLSSGMPFLVDDIRIRGPMPGVGIVDVRLNGAWLSLCNYGWNYAAENLVCRHLGFSFGAEIHYFPPDNDIPVLRPVYGGALCEKSARRLSDCYLPAPSPSACNEMSPDIVSNINCNASSKSGWQLTNKTAGFPILAGHVSHTPITLCDVNFGLGEAMLLCRSLGLGDRSVSLEKRNVTNAREYRSSVVYCPLGSLTFDTCLTRPSGIRCTAGPWVNCTAEFSKRVPTASSDISLVVILVSTIVGSLLLIVGVAVAARQRLKQRHTSASHDSRVCSPPANRQHCSLQQVPNYEDVNRGVGPSSPNPGQEKVMLHPLNSDASDYAEVDVYQNINHRLTPKTSMPSLHKRDSVCFPLMETKPASPPRKSSALSYIGDLVPLQEQSFNKLLVKNAGNSLLPISPASEDRQLRRYSESEFASGQQYQNSIRSCSSSVLTNSPPFTPRAVTPDHHDLHQCASNGLPSNDTFMLDCKKESLQGVFIMPTNDIVSSRGKGLSYVSRPAKNQHGAITSATDHSYCNTEALQGRQSKHNYPQQQSIRRPWSTTSLPDHAVSYETSNVTMSDDSQRVRPISLDKSLVRNPLYDFKESFNVPKADNSQRVGPISLDKSLMQNPLYDFTESFNMSKTDSVLVPPSYNDLHQQYSSGNSS